MHAQLMGHALGDLQVLLGAVDSLQAENDQLRALVAALQAQAGACSCGGGR